MFEPKESLINYLTISQFAKERGLTWEGVYMAIKQGRLPSYIVRGKHYINIHSVILRKLNGHLYPPKLR